MGHTLCEWPREYEHSVFLKWLTQTLVEKEVDALLIAGDIFDNANPSAWALRTWYDFLATARQQCPNLDMIVIGGNHDSPARLDAANPILRALRVHVVGGITATHKISPHSLVFPLHHRGIVAAQVAAVPYLRPIDLPHHSLVHDPGRLVEPPPISPSSASETFFDDPLIDGVHRYYATIISQAKNQRPTIPLIAMGHLYMAGGQLSELSERKILGGNQHALPSNIFGNDIVYGALGHLHRPQAIQGKPFIRYCGAPLALDSSEANYQHQVYLVDLDENGIINGEALRTPRSVEFIRIPEKDALPLDELLPRLSNFDDRAYGTDEMKWPFVEVAVRLTKPEPGLHRKIEATLESKRIRLVRIRRELTGTGYSLAQTTDTKNLRDLDPEEVFAERYKRDHQGGGPPEPLLQAFRLLLNETRGGS